MKRGFKKLLTVGSALYLLAPQLVSAAGEKASDLVVVADTRVLPNGIMKYFANLYNTIGKRRCGNSNPTSSGSVWTTGNSGSGGGQRAATGPFPPARQGCWHLIF